MPGVPSGRGCEACRKQKKKCDQQTPCSRCARLNVTCIGAGQRRFKFQPPKSYNQQGQQSSTAENHTDKDRFKLTAVKIPSNLNNAKLSNVQALAKIIDQSTDLRFNIAWTYGCFFEEIPKRLAVTSNEAFETATAALVQTHRDYCSFGSASPDALSKYSYALRTLQQYLSIPVKATASETLCAVMILLICQAFIGNDGRCWTGHCEGAAQLLKARRFYDPNDPFESKLVLSLRGPVVVEGIFNPNIRLTPSEWARLVENHMDGSTHEGHMMQSLARVPDFIRRGRKIRRGYGGDLFELTTDVLSCFEMNSKAVEDLERRIGVVEGHLSNHKQPRKIYEQAHIHLHRSQAFCLSATVIVGVILGAVSFNSEWLASQLASYSERLQRHVEYASKHRPLGVAHVPLCLSAAWLGTTELSKRSDILIHLVRWHAEFHQSEDACTLHSQLRRARQHLMLEMQDANYSTLYVQQ